jgi:cytochrome c-type biogenesis protein CcmF
MGTLGQILTLLSLFLSLLVVILGFSQKRHLLQTSIEATYSLFFIDLAASFCLLELLVTHDFSNRYVASYTDSSMPLVYVLSAFWAGEKGALLFWALVQAGLMVVVVRVEQEANLKAVVAIMGIAHLFFAVLMVFASNPFDTFATSSGPPDGNGMNPLLQNPLMAIHPPLQLAGFIAWSAPFAFGMSSLLFGGTGSKWLGVARKWYLLAWALHTAGLVVGGLWAYVELGWGGFWGWDPVENGALIPWLTGTAFVHSASVEIRTSHFRRWNYFLMSLTFILCIFATFLTRSQLINSLHSFENSVLTPYFLYYLLFLIVGSVFVLVLHHGNLKSSQRIGGVFSREGLVFVSNILFLLLTFVVIWGTLLPKVSESQTFKDSFNGLIRIWNSLNISLVPELREPLTVGPDWFNKATAPIGALILLLSGIAPLLPYRTSLSRTIWRKLTMPALLSLVLSVVTVALLESQADETENIFDRIRSFGFLVGLIVILFANFSLFVALLDLSSAIRARMKGANLGFPRALGTVFCANPRRFGGHIVHTGVALCFLAFAGYGQRTEIKDAVLRPMDSLSVGGNDIVFLGLHSRYSPEGYAALVAKILVAQKDRPVQAVSLDETPPDVQIESGERPFFSVMKFKRQEDAQNFFLKHFSAVFLQQDLVVAEVDKKSLTVALAPRSLEAINIIPGDFHRLADELKQMATIIGQNRVSLEMSKGDPLLFLRFQDASLLQPFVDGFSMKPHFLGVFLDPSEPSKIRVIPEGAFKVVEPEVRLYPRFENPTTEVAIDVRILSDLYVAFAKAQGSRSIMLTVSQNPFITLLWIGSAVMIMCVLVLFFLSTFSSKAPATDAVFLGEVVEGIGGKG